MPHQLINVTRLTWPIEQPIAMDYLKLDADQDADVVDVLLKAAIAYCESYANRYFSSVVVTEEHRPCGNIELGFPADEIVSITHVDGSDETEIDNSSYEMVRRADTTYLCRTDGEEWATDGVHVIEYKTGGEGCPDDVKSAILLTLGKWYEHREDSVHKMPTASERILMPHRRMYFR